MARLGSALARAALSLVLTVGLVPAVAFADSDDAAASDAYTFQVWSENSLTGGSGEIVVDEAAGLSLLSDDGVDLASAEILEYEDAVKAVTEALGSRAAQVSVTIEEGEDWGSQWEAIVEDALAEDGNPAHGDYLRYVLGRVGAWVSGWPVTGGRYNATYDYSFGYMTTAAQEQELNAKVDEVLADLDLDSKTNYQKAEAIYRFICANVAYDYANLNDDSYKLKYTAYAALINGTSVCQGYASLFYLMAGKAGLPCRIVSGTGNGEAHSWNIVQMDDGLWYNIDVTWDENRLTWDYFLKSDADFGNHVRSGAEADDMYRENYSSEAFYAAHPMGSTSYDPNVETGGEGEDKDAGGEIGENDSDSDEGNSGEAGETDIPSSDFLYEVSDNGKATITGYSGSATDIVIPAEIDGYPVSRIDAQYAFRNSGVESIAVSEGISVIGLAFQGCDTLRSVSIPSTVTTIYDGAFDMCFALEIITVAPDNGHFALNGPALLTSDETRLLCYPKAAAGEAYAIPEGVTTIDNGAFRRCANLKEVFIPSSLTSIGNALFMECSSLEEVSIPSAVTSIGGSAFSGCSSLKSVDIPEGVTAIGPMAFQFCSSLACVAMPEGLISIEDSTFLLCESLESITIPESVTSIGDKAFYHCEALENVVVPEGVTSIGDDAFAYCESLENVSLPSTLTYLGKGVFNECYALKGYIVVPDGVTSIGEYSFYGCDIESVIIPEGVTSIGHAAFYGCESLREAIIPSTVTSIDDFAFSYCSMLEEVAVPEGVAAINDYAFQGCTSLASVSIPSSITSIGKYAFYGGAFENIVIPEGVTSIGEGAFCECALLESIVIPEGVTVIEDDVFDGCTSLKSIVIPSTVTSVGMEAFWGCAFENIDLPEGLTSIGESAFCGCESLLAIEIPSTVTYIGEQAFCECKSLKNIVIPEDVTSIGDRTFLYCYALESATVPSSVESLGYKAFGDCRLLTNISLAEGLTSIGEQAFFGCGSLESISLPSTVSEFGYGAFHGIAPNSTIVTSTQSQTDVLDGNSDYIVIGDTTVVSGGESEPDPDPEPAPDVEVGDLSLHGIDGTIRSLEEDYLGKRYVIVGGRSTCWNTQSAVSDILSLQKEQAYSDIALVVLDVDGDFDAFQSGFAESRSDNAYFASSDDWSYNGWLWSMLEQVDPEAAASGSISLPFVFVVDEEGTVLWGGAGYFFARETLNDVFGIDATEPEPDTGSGTVYLAVTVDVNQEEARKLFDMVNVARGEAGVATLKWDEELEAAALQRAAELAVQFSHTRPDGSSCFTAFPPYGAAAENIAAGYGNAAAVNLGWTNSAGHYANMIGAAYTSMAAACVLVDGYPYWVELFTDRAGSSDLGEPLVSDGVVFPVSVPADGLALSLDSPEKMVVGDTVDLLELVSALGMPLANSSGLAWESSDPSVLQVDANGHAVALAPGIVQVTVSLAGDSSVSATAECAVDPLSIDGATIGSMSGQTYTGFFIEPKPVVTLDGETLVPGTDYVLSYRNNLNAGEATVVVSGIGNYEGAVEAAFEIVPATLVATYAGESVAWGEAPSLAVSVEGFVGGESAHTAAGYAAPAVALPILEPGRSYELAPAGGAADNYVFEYVAGTLSVGKCDIASVEGLEIADQRHSGLPVEPQLELSFGGVALVEGVDYEVAYVNNVEAGTATAVVTGKGGFTGEARVEFEIVDGPSDLWKRFPDVAADVKKAGGPENVWYVADGWLDYVVEAGLMTGYASDGFFGRYDLIPRCQVATILYRAECAKDPSLVGRYGSTTDGKSYAQNCFFEDMRANQYYTAAINWAKDAGVMTGDSKTGYKTVRPDDPVSRQELCLMLARYANGGSVPETALDPSKAQGILGMDEVASWARDGVNWAVNNGVIGGVDNKDGTYSMDPTDTTWRASAAKMFTVVMRDVM